MLQSLNQKQIISFIRATNHQSYELLEYTTTRLFIVLPRLKRKIDKILRPFKKQLRLYFLCECGPHIQHGDHQVPHRMRLAKHEGYDLDQVDEFFVKMLKVGPTVTGITVRHWQPSKS